MDTAQEAYQTAARIYAERARALFSPTFEARAAERGEAVGSTQDLAARAEAFLPSARDLAAAAAALLEHYDPMVRGEAAAQLLAKALVEAQASELLFQAAETGQIGVPPSSVVERGARAIPSIEEPLAVILGQRPIGMVLERGGNLPQTVPAAQAALCGRTADTLTLVKDRVSRTGQAALNNLVTMGINQLGQAAALVTMEVAGSIGAGEALSRLYTLFREFFASAYEAVLTALGPTVTKAAANQVFAWFNDYVQGKKFAEFLDKAYQIPETKANLEQMIQSSSARLENYRAALAALGVLDEQFTKQMGLLEKVEVALRFISAVPAAALPQARLLFGAIHIAIAGYAVYAGADAVDAPDFPRLDRFHSPTRILRETIERHETSAKPPSRQGENSPPPELEREKAHGRGGITPPKSRSTGAAGRGRKGSSSGSGTHKPGGGSPQPQAPRPITRGEDAAHEANHEGTGDSKPELVEEKIRIDLAVPESPVAVGEMFEVAVAIRRPRAAKLEVDGLGSVTSSGGTVYRREEDELVRYHINLTASSCAIETNSYTFQLRAGRDSEPCFFQLTPTRAGTINITVTAYQEDGDLVGQTRRQLQAVLHSVQPATNRQTLQNQLDRKKRAVGKRSAQGEKEYQNFDVNLYDYRRSKKGKESYRVNIRSNIVRDLDLNRYERVTIPADLRQRLRMLENRALDEAEIVALGRQLGKMLLPEKARTYYWQSQKALLKNQALRIRIITSNYPLASIAWEYAFIPPEDNENITGEQGFLALDKRISIVRYEVLGKAVREMDPPGGEKLRMVLLMANPPGYPELQLDQEEKNIRDALKQVHGIRLQVYPNASIQDLEDALLDPAQIFHFAGHGAFQSQLGKIRGTETGTGCILLNEPDPDRCLLPATRLAATLRDCGVRMAVLGVCESGERDQENAWTGIAAALSFSEIPAVVAMQFRVLDTSAIAFHRAFYRTLCAGHSIDMAVANGRQAIANRAKGDRDWGVPVLYLRAEGQSFLFGKPDERAEG